MLFSDPKRHRAVVLGRIFVILGGSRGWLLPSERVWIQRRRRRCARGSSSSAENRQRDAVHHFGSGQRPEEQWRVHEWKHRMVVQTLLQVDAELLVQRRMECSHRRKYQRCCLCAHAGETRLMITSWNVKCLKSNSWKQDDICNKHILKKINNRERRVYCLSYWLK